MYIDIYIYTHTYITPWCHATSRRNRLHPVFITRFPSFRTQPLESLSIDSVKNGFLRSPAPGENLESGNLVMETGCIIIIIITIIIIVTTIIVKHMKSNDNKHMYIYIYIYVHTYMYIPSQPYPSAPPPPETREPRNETYLSISVTFGTTCLTRLVVCTV